MLQAIVRSRTAPMRLKDQSCGDYAGTSAAPLLPGHDAARIAARRHYCSSISKFGRSSPPVSRRTVR